LGNATSMLAQTRLGSIQFSVLGDSNLTGIVPAYAIGTLAFAFSSWQQAIDVLQGSLGSYLRQQLPAKGLVGFDGTWTGGFTQVLTSAKRLRTVDDFAGVKVRTSNAAIIIEFFTALGAEPVVVPQDEIYASLQTHVIDGAENSITLTESFRFFEVAKYLN